jgi:hypothetical protein
MSIRALDECIEPVVVVVVVGLVLLVDEVDVARTLDDEAGRVEELGAAAFLKKNDEDFFNDDFELIAAARRASLIRIYFFQILEYIY